MSVLTRLTLLFMAGLFFVCGAYVTNWDRARHLQRELDDAQSRLEAAQGEIEKLHIEHRDTMDAIQSSLNAREMVHEQAKRREQLLQEVLDDNPGISGLVIPDSMRMCLQWDPETRTCSDEIPAPAGIITEYRDTGQDGGEDGGGHGENHP